jgi:hypothetical protein
MGFLRMTEDSGQTLIIAEHGVIGNHKEAPVMGQCYFVVHDVTWSQKILLTLRSLRSTVGAPSLIAKSAPQLETTQLREMRSVLTQGQGDARHKPEEA